MCLSLILWDRILAMKLSILRQNTGRKSKQIMAADDNISHFNSHSSLQVIVGYNEVTTASTFNNVQLRPWSWNTSQIFCECESFGLCAPWTNAFLTVSYRHSRQTSYSIFFQPTTWAELPPIPRQLYKHSQFRKANKCLEHDSSNSQSSLHIDWFQLPIKCMLQEDFGPPVTAKKAPHYAIYHISHSLCYNKPASMFWLKSVNSIYD